MNLFKNKIFYVLLTIFFSSLFLIEPAFASNVVESSQSWEEFNMFKAIVTSIIMLALIWIIATERIHRTMISFLFAALLIFVSHTIWYFFPDYFQFITLDQAFGSIHGEVIALLAWMMIIVWVLSETGLFQRIALKYLNYPLVGSFDAAWANWTILWWALAFGACFWWNWSLIWASANIVTIWIMEKEWIKFSFLDFLKVWFPAMLIQVILASWVIYWMVNFL